MPAYPYGLKGIPGFKRTRSQKAPSNSPEFPTIKKGLGGLPKRRQVPLEWVLTVDITAGGQDWSVDINSGTGVDIKIDWDDGSVDYFTTTGEKNHVYSTPGLYFPRISGKFSSSGNIRFGKNSGNRSRLKATGVVPYIPGLVSFQSTFSSCTNLTTIPADLFRYNPTVSAYVFSNTFYGCTGLTSIPADLFRYNTAVGANAFSGTFYGCTNLTTIPADLFRYNTAVSVNGFSNTFYGCTNLTSIPADLFRYNTACLSFSSTFYGCNKLTLRSDMFCAAGEEGIRFNNQSVDFTNCMRLSGGFTGTQGTAPALWNFTFGSGTPTKTSCFTSHSTSSITNYGAIPAEWH